MKVLVVDDEADLLELIAFSLRRAGIQVSVAQDLAGAAQRFAIDDPDLLVLDVNLGESNGLDFLVELRKTNPIPVILLTGRDREQDIVDGLQLGADDYVTKPFSHRELLARIQARLRGLPQTQLRQAPQVLQAGPLTLRVAEHTADYEGRPLELTVTEFRLLRCLMTNAGTVVPTRSLLQEVWGYDDATGTDLVRVAVYRLRRKLSQVSGDTELLRTVPGVGVILKPEDA